MAVLDKARKALDAAEEVWLVFDGIDTIGRVYLNEAPPPHAA